MDRMEGTMNSQDEFGLEKYGKPLDPMDDYDWLDMAEQEIADMIKYFNCERERRDYFIGKVLKDLEAAWHLTLNPDAKNYIENSMAKLGYLVKKR